jgi:hypothetical protein
MYVCEKSDDLKTNIQIVKINTDTKGQESALSEAVAVAVPVPATVSPWSPSHI